MKVGSIKAGHKSGFTILEVMVALAIVGISIGIFFGLIGNSLRLRGKIDEHTRFLLLARTKTEEAFLGVLGKEHTKITGAFKEEKTFEGATKDGIHWKVTQVDKYKEIKKRIATMDISQMEEVGIELPPKGTMALSIHVEGIDINTIIFSEESETDESETEESQMEEDDGGKSGEEGSD